LRRTRWTIRDNVRAQLRVYVKRILRKHGYPPDKQEKATQEGKEPAHIHVEQVERYAKFWLTPIGLAKSRGFRSNELTELTGLVRQHRTLFEERWNEHFRNQG
jgi:hypothetical protein